EVGDLLRFARAVGRYDVNLFAPAAVGYEGDPFAVGRKLRFFVARGAVGDLAQVALICRGGGDFAVGRKRDASARRREVVIVQLRIEIARLDQVLLRLGGDVELDGRSLAAGHVQFPYSEVVLKDDHFAVGAHRRPAHVAGLKRSHPFGFAAFFAHAPDVGQAVAFAVADEVDVAVTSPHRP